MFTAQREIKHLATKELLSLLPNKCYLGSVPLLVDLKCFEKCYINFWPYLLLQTKLTLTGHTAARLPLHCSSLIRRVINFLRFFWRAFLKFENSKFCSSKPKQRRRRAQVFPIPIRSVRPNWAIYWTLVTF